MSVPSVSTKQFKPFKEPWKNFLQERKNEYDQHNFPGVYKINGPQRGKWEDETANGLTRAIIDFLKYEGGNFTRVNVMGVPRKNKYGQMIMTKSTTQTGTADIVGCICGLYMAIEVKIGSDTQSDDQQKEEQRVKEAGGIYFIAKSFPGFLKTFETYRERIQHIKAVLVSIGNR